MKYMHHAEFKDKEDIWVEYSSMSSINDEIDFMVLQNSFLNLKDRPLRISLFADKDLVAIFSGNHELIWRKKGC
jgi:hypothetical protein